MLKISIFIFGALSIFASASLSAKTSIERTTSFYDVNGATAKALFNDIERKKPTATATNTRMQAITKWRISWTYSMTSDAAGCSITAADVVVKSDIKVPRFVGYTNASPLLKRKWNDFFRTLYAHEKNHSANGEKAGRQIDKALKKMRANSCSILDTRARDRGQSIVDQYFAQDLAYDRRTRNGRTEVKSLSQRASIGNDLNNYKRIFNESPLKMHKRYERGEGVYVDARYSALWLLNAHMKGNREATKTLNGKGTNLKRATRKALQKHLKDRGFYNAKLDGEFGAGTRRAIKAWRNSPDAKTLQVRLLTNQL